jgi:signal transduction histidine kinase/putative methionine-R-sulfoxide reductase with GAF domain
MTSAVTDKAYLLSVGRSSDPLLEGLVSGEGYKVAEISSLSEADGGCGVIVVQLGAGAGDAQVEELLREALDRLPSARVLVTSDGAVARRAPEFLKKLPEDRLLWLEGDIAEPGHVENVRRFLRGEGYHWASDLGAVPDEDTLLLESDRYGESRQDKFRNVLRFTGDLSRFTETRPMLQEALSRILDILECDAGSIYLWDENTETLVLDAAQGPDKEERLGLRQKLGEGLAGWVAEVGESILVTDSRRIQRLGKHGSARYSNFSCIATPITQGGQLFGVVCITEPRNHRSLDAQDLRATQVLARKLSSVLRPLSVLSELRRFSDRLLGAFRTSSRVEMKMDAQVESLRVMSANILESIPMAVIAYDCDLRVRSANRVARKTFGTQTARTDIPAPAPLENGLSLDHELWRSRLASVVTSGREFRLQRVAYRHGDASLTLDIHCSPLFDPEGKTAGGILTVQDVTEDVELEAKLSSAERLALIGKLAAKVAHELNNPLDGILRFLNLAMKRLDDPEKTRSYLEDSRTGLLRMSNILTELLAFSRSHRGRTEQLSLTQVIRHGLAPFEQRAQEANIAIIRDVPSNLPPAPSPDVWEVVSNVIKNALDAVGENGTVTVRAVHEDDVVRLTVSDTGPGVPPELGEKIFEPFFTTKKGSLGTGLGLALCRDTLRRFGGDIELVGSDKGAAFEMIIPVKTQTESDA